MPNGSAGMSGLAQAAPGLRREGGNQLAEQVKRIEIGGLRRQTEAAETEDQTAIVRRIVGSPLVNVRQDGWRFICIEYIDRRQQQV